MLIMILNEESNIFDFKRFYLFQLSLYRVYSTCQWMSTVILGPIAKA